MAAVATDGPTQMINFREQFVTFFKIPAFQPAFHNVSKFYFKENSVTNLIN